MKMNQPVIRRGSLALLASVVTGLAFTGVPGQNPVPHRDRNVAQLAHYSNDTIPTKRNKVTRENSGDRDLDKELCQLDEAKQKLEQLKDKDWDEISREVEASIYKIDFDKIQRQVDNAMKRIDYAKMQRQVQESLARIDFNKIQRDIDKSMEEVKGTDKEEIKREIEKAKMEVDKAMKNEEWKKNMQEAQHYSREKVKKAMENAKREMARAKEEMKNQQFNLKKQMDKAREDIGAAKEEMKSYQEMIYEMEKDGLLNTKEDYNIEYKSGDLFIDDKKQPQTVTDKYSKYFKKKNIAIKKQGGKMKINHHEHSDKHLD
jgi:hypothetical protein